MWEEASVNIIVMQESVNIAMHPLEHVPDRQYSGR